LDAALQQDEVQGEDNAFQEPGEPKKPTIQKITAAEDVEEPGRLTATANPASLAEFVSRSTLGKRGASAFSSDLDADPVPVRPIKVRVANPVDDDLASSAD
jgi:hypothetical protein